MRLYFDCFMYQKCRKVNKVKRGVAKVIVGEENLSEIVFCYLGILILGNGGAELDPPAC